MEKSYRRVASIGEVTSNGVVPPRWGARPHSIIQIFCALEEYFGNRVIAFNYSNFISAGKDSPLYSADFNPFKYFLWDVLKYSVSQNNSPTLDDLVEKISAVCASITLLVMLQGVMANFIVRLL